MCVWCRPCWNYDIELILYDEIDLYIIHMYDAGIGEKKVKRLYQALHTPFKRLRAGGSSSEGGVSTASTPYATSSHDVDASGEDVQKYV